MKVIIHDLTNWTKRVVNNEKECRNNLEKSAYQTAIQFNDVITMGKIIVEPIKG